MEQWEHGFFEGKNPDMNKTLELEIGNEANSLVKELLPQQCTAYNILSDESRHHSSSYDYKCDLVGKDYTSIDWKGPGWYRVKDETHGSNRLASSSEVTKSYKCGTYRTGYLKSPVHPKIGETKNATVCFFWDTNSCHTSIEIKVTNCGSFFVYHLPNAPICLGRYCIGP